MNPLNIINIYNNWEIENISNINKRCKVENIYPRNSDLFIIYQSTPCCYLMRVFIEIQLNK